MNKCVSHFLASILLLQKPKEIFRIFFKWNIMIMHKCAVLIMNRKKKKKEDNSKTESSIILRGEKLFLYIFQFNFINFEINV